MNRLTFAFIVLSFTLLLPASAPAGESGGPTTREVLRVFSEADVQTRRLVKPAKSSGWFASAPAPYWEEKQEFLFSGGTGWLINYHGDAHLLTAAHVLYPPVQWDPVETPLAERRKVLSAHRRLYVGPLEYEPEFLGSPTAENADGGDFDVLAMKFAASTATHALQGVHVYTFAAERPTTGEGVVAIGYGKEKLFADHVPASITSVSPNGVFFVINVQVDPGFSGGVVLNSDGKALGVITGTTNGQTTVVVVNDNVLSRVRLLPYSAIQKSPVLPKGD